MFISLWMPSTSTANQCLGLGEDLNMCAEITAKNVLGGELELCCSDPVTGFYRNGFCQTGTQDAGTHVVCAQVTQGFLEFSKAQGNDLMTPAPNYNFAGLKSGDKWCMCARRWTQALEAGVAPPLVLEATHEKMLEYTEIEVLKKHALEANEPIQQSRANAHQFSFQSIDGDNMPLRGFKGKVLLIVNTASQCGFTDQYKDLQTLYETYKERGLIVIGVPCNDFGKQEPGHAEVIKDFTSKKFGVTFPLTQKYSVKGGDAHPFFIWATEQKKGAFLQSSPKWNFHKFLIDKNGDLVKSFSSQVNPSSSKIREEIERALK
jgi:glutathione peroxidase-family protein/uncharacterized protein (DUF2237 family)